MTVNNRQSTFYGSTLEEPGILFGFLAAIPTLYVNPGGPHDKC